MLYRFAAGTILLLHFAFIVFALFGALLASRWRWVVLLHIPAAAWGVLIELTGGVCPLTYVENFLHRKAGESGYTTSFIEHYLLAVIYPAGLTRELQIFLAGVVIVINVAMYSWLFRPAALPIFACRAE